MKPLDLPCAATRGFDILVKDIARWWPGDHSVSGEAGEVPRAVTLEPKVGGAVFETMYNGARSPRGEVLAFEDGRHLAMTWHPGTNADNPTLVDVTFEVLSYGTSRLTLTHSGREAWAEIAHERRAGCAKGWDVVLVEGFLPVCG